MTIILAIQLNLEAEMGDKCIMFSRRSHKGHQMLWCPLNNAMCDALNDFLGVLSLTIGVFCYNQMLRACGHKLFCVLTF